MGCVCCCPLTEEEEQARRPILAEESHTPSEPISIQSPSFLGKGRATPCFCTIKSNFDKGQDVIENLNLRISIVFCPKSEFNCSFRFTVDWTRGYAGRHSCHTYIRKRTNSAQLLRADNSSRSPRSRARYALLLKLSLILFQPLSTIGYWKKTNYSRTTLAIFA